MLENGLYFEEVESTDVMLTSSKGRRHRAWKEFLRKIKSGSSILMDLVQEEWALAFKDMVDEITYPTTGVDCGGGCTSVEGYGCGNVCNNGGGGTW